MMNTGAIIQDLIDWIDNHLDSRLDIDTVARRAGYSKWHLQRIFKEHTGQPLGEYIRAKKLQKSIERLAHSNEPILNVAIALGFDSQQSFNRSFKRQYGQAPALWAAFAGSPARHRTIFGNMACRRHRRRSLSTGLCIISPVRRGGPMSSASFAMARPFLYPSAATPR